MNNIFFSIIIPNYNNEIYLEKSLTSVLNQTFINYELFIVDDVSLDSSVNIIKNILNKYQNKNTQLVELKEKAWNGGSRNIGIKKAKGKYILFLDSDDWLTNNTILESLHIFLTQKNYPDFVRLPFQILTPEETIVNVPLCETNLKNIANSCFVGAPTKCIKREKMVLFPENTLMEDAVQHIAQVDNIETFDNFKNLFFVYNKQNTHSTSTDQKQQNAKWESSLYRMYADLLDLKCVHNYCEERRQWKLNQIKNNIKNDSYVQ